MGRRHGILGRATTEPLRQRGRESFVGGLNGDIDDRPQGGHEPLRLGGLLAVLTAERQREPDHDELCPVLGDEACDLGEAGVGGCLPDDADGPAMVPLVSETATPVRAEP